MRRTLKQGLGLVTVAFAVVGFAPLADAEQGLTRAVIAIASSIALRLLELSDVKVINLVPALFIAAIASAAVTAI